MKKFLLLFSALIYSAIGFAQQITEIGNYFGITPTVEVDGKFYEPFISTCPFSLVSTGMKAYTETDSKLVPFEEAVIPAATRVIIECVSSDPADNLIDMNVQDAAALRDNGVGSARLGVYSILGVKLRHDSNIDDLPAGIYIVNGKKIIKK